MFTVLHRLLLACYISRRLWLKKFGTVVLQITTCRQGAIGIVYAYPLTNRNIQICEALATLKDEPSVQELLEDTTVNDAQHVTNWEQVVKFAKGVKPEQIPYYNRFVSRSLGDLELTHAGC